MGLVDSFKGFMGINNGEYDEDLEDSYEEDYEEEQPEHNSRFTRKSNVVPMNQSSSASQASITIIKPKKFDDVASIADVLKSRRPVIFDVSDLESEVASKIVDFMSGAVYGLNGNIKRVSGGIFITTPEHMSIANEEMRQTSRSSLNLEF